MKTAWAALAKCASQPQDLVDYLEYARLHSTVMWPGLWGKVPVRSTQRQALKRIAKLSKELIKELEAIGGTGQATLNGVFNQLVTHSYAQQKKSPTFVHAFSPNQTPAGLPRGTGIKNVLESLIQAAEHNLQAPPRGPRKLKAKSADRTAYIQDLSRYVKQNFGKPLNEVVATTVSTSLNLHKDHQVDESLVRRLPRSTRKISVKLKP
jgi:hypothetical protein